MRVITVGELKAALAGLDDKLPIAHRPNGSFWSSGLDIEEVELETLGRGRDRATFSADDPVMQKWHGKRSKPFKAIGIT
jgi:hypothetical protein